MGNYLIIQVKCFLVFNQPVTKDISKLSCTPHSNSTVALDNHKIVGHKKFNLIATINHSGNLPRGHHTSFIKYASSSSSSSWFHCNDAAVIPSNETALINDTLCLENMRKHFRSSASLPFAQQLVFSYIRFSMDFQVNKSPLITILDVFRGGPACYPRTTVSLVIGAETVVQIY